VLDHRRPGGVGVWGSPADPGGGACSDTWQTLPAVRSNRSRRSVSMRL